MDATIFTHSNLVISVSLALGPRLGQFIQGEDLQLGRDLCETSEVSRVVCENGPGGSFSCCRDDRVHHRDLTCGT